MNPEDLTLSEEELNIISDLRSPNVAGVLYYCSLGTTKPCGTTVGATGAGEYAVVFYGDPDKCETRAREIIKTLHKSHHTIRECRYIPNEDTYSGNTVTVEIIK